jgi:hypothetical protein
MLSTGFTISAFVALLVVSFVAAEDDCLSGLACRPWSKFAPCSIGGSMNTRFIVERWDNGSVAMPFGESSFCPLVDQNEAFILENTGDYVEPAFWENNQSSTVNNTKIWLYGQGNLNTTNVHEPIAHGSGVLLSYMFPSQGSPEFGTGCSNGELAVASFLMINFTMTNGIYLYKAVPAGDTIDGNPINAGWVSTCDASNQCLFGDAACIGMGGVMNCARCYDQTSVQTAKTRVWAAYYGTDASGRSFVSGQDNPLNFLQYASGSAYTTIANNL